LSRFEDLSPYTYTPGIGVPQNVEAFNIGWLEHQNGFPRGHVPEECVESLGALCRDDSRNAMRGLFPCTLPHPEGQPDYPVSIEVGGQEVTLGAAEIRVVTQDGRWLIAPNLVHHYITAHSYLPPAEFIEAVTARRTAPRT
jgi:hypothetical protein